MTRLLDDLDVHVQREDLGIFPVSVVTLGATGWAIVDEAHARSPSFLLDPDAPPGSGPGLTARQTHRSTNDEDTMQKESLTALVRHHLETASTASSGRSAHTIYGGHEHVLRQTLIALARRLEPGRAREPGEATVQVLHGRVTLVAGENRWNGSPGTSCRSRLPACPRGRRGLGGPADGGQAELTPAPPCGVTGLGSCFGNGK